MISRLYFIGIQRVLDYVPVRVLYPPKRERSKLKASLR